MSVQSTRDVLMRYFDAASGDTSMLADDVVYRVMGTGQEAHTPQGVVEFLHFMYMLPLKRPPAPEAWSSMMVKECWKQISLESI